MGLLLAVGNNDKEVESTLTSPQLDPDLEYAVWFIFETWVRVDKDCDFVRRGVVLVDVLVVVRFEGGLIRL